MGEIIEKVKDADREYRTRNKGMKIVCYADDAIYLRMKTIYKDSCIDLNWRRKNITRPYLFKEPSHL